MNEGHDAAKLYFIKTLRRHKHYKCMLNNEDFIYVKDISNIHTNGYLCNIHINNIDSISYHIMINDVWKRIREECDRYAKL